VSAGEREDAIINTRALREIQGIGRYKFREGEVLGQPSDDVRSKLIGSGVRLFTPFLSL
jgi:hypothetical protein